MSPAPANLSAKRGLRVAQTRAACRATSVLAVDVDGVGPRVPVVPARRAQLAGSLAQHQRSTLTAVIDDVGLRRSSDRPAGRELQAAAPGYVAAISGASTVPPKVAVADSGPSSRNASGSAAKQIRRRRRVERELTAQPRRRVSEDSPRTSPA